jgi:hypothetical protein
MNYGYLETRGQLRKLRLTHALNGQTPRLGWIHQLADSPFMPCMDRQSADSPEHTAEDGSINVADSPCNNYIARVSHPASLGFGVAPSSKTFF